MKLYSIYVIYIIYDTSKSINKEKIIEERQK